MDDIEMTPITRKEFYFAGITGMDVQAPSPMTRLETYLNDILNGTVSQLVPITRPEFYLAKISGADVNIPVPVTRLEVYLAAIAGMDIDVPDPITREEYFLAEWAENSSEHTYGPAAIVSFETTKAKLMKSLLIDLQPIQDLHGYDHPWPGGGGKNLIPDGTDTNNGFAADSYLKANGSIGTVSGINVSEYFPVLPSTVYGWKKYEDQASVSASVCFYDSAKSFISGEAYNGRTDFTITSPANAAFCRVSILVLLNPETTLFMVGDDYPDTWQPYSNICPISGRTGANVYVSPTQDEADATTYPVTWQTEAGTVYAGSVDVVTGVLTVDRKLVTLTGADNWVVAGTSKFYCPLSSQEYSQSTSEDAQISSIYLFGATQSGGSADVTQDKHFYLQRTYTLEYCRVWVYDTDYTLETFKAMLNNTPLQVTYPIVPTTYQFDPQTVQTLVGQNVVWSDAGEVTVTV